MFVVEMTAENLYRLAWLSRPLMQTVEACVEQGLAQTGLTVRMRAVLEILAKHGDLSVPEIASHIFIKRQYVQVMVNETIASGFTKHTDNPRHKNSPLISLTDAGREIIIDTIQNEMSLMKEIARDFNDKDIVIAIQVVMKFEQKLKDINER